MVALIIAIVLIIILLVVVIGGGDPENPRPRCDICGKREGVADQHGFICMTCAGWGSTK